MKAQLSAMEKSEIDSEVSRLNAVPLEKDHFLARGNKELAWKKYCGFMEFSIDEFNSIQKLLLREQVEISLHSALGREILGDRVPESLEEFRRFTPLTSCSDYENRFVFNAGSGPLEGFSSDGKLTPVSSEACPPARKTFCNHIAARSLVDDAITALILSSAAFKGDVRLEPLDKMLISLRVKTISQTVNEGISQRLECDNLMPPEDDPLPGRFGGLDQGIENSLKKGIDFIISTPDAIVSLGEVIDFTTIRSHFGFNLSVACRLIKTWLVGHVSGREILAKDIWQVKGLVCCDERNTRFEERIERAWGVRPLNVYYAPETGVMALQSWNKKGLTFIPYRNLYEFIPLAELEKEAWNSRYVPATVLMNEVKPGELYELVVTNFRGGPFLRYRIGDYLQVLALKDEETGVNLPQFTLCPKPVLKSASAPLH